MNCPYVRAQCDKTVIVCIVIFDEVKSSVKETEPFTPETIILP